MKDVGELTVGYISYLNCVPYFHFLRECGFRGELIGGVPSALNAMLQRGEIDISPSSSFEYARHWRDYLLLSDHSISSVGKVESVLLFSPCELAELEGKKIAITGDSATSINLLRVILREFVKLTAVCDEVPDVPVERLIAERQPALLIGDRAMQMAADCPAGMQIFDLGELWQQYTGLPFVFALWMVRRKIVGENERQIAELSKQLVQARQQLMANPEPVAFVLSKEKGLSSQLLVDYWHCINYDLESEQQKGLELFFDLCFKHKLLPERPVIEFFSAESELAQICS